MKLKKSESGPVPILSIRHTATRSLLEERSFKQDLKKPVCEREQTPTADCECFQQLVHGVMICDVRLVRTGRSARVI